MAGLVHVGQYYPWGQVHNLPCTQPSLLNARRLCTSEDKDGSLRRTMEGKGGRKGGGLWGGGEGVGGW